MGRGYRDLEVWKAGMDLAVDCYALTDRFPNEERYGLSAQIRNAAASIPANIAEGKTRRYTRDFLRFVLVARGSAAELETLLELVARLGYADPAMITSLLERADHVGRMLSRLAASLRRHLPKKKVAP